jgi:hypothetical protein
MKQSAPWQRGGEGGEPDAKRAPLAITGATRSGALFAAAAESDSASVDEGTLEEEPCDDVVDATFTDKGYLLRTQQVLTEHITAGTTYLIIADVRVDNKHNLNEYQQRHILDKALTVRYYCWLALEYYHDTLCGLVAKRPGLTKNLREGAAELDKSVRPARLLQELAGIPFGKSGATVGRYLKDCKDNEGKFSIDRRGQHDHRGENWLYNQEDMKMAAKNEMRRQGTAVSVIRMCIYFNKTLAELTPAYRTQHGVEDAISQTTAWRWMHALGARRDFNKKKYYTDRHETAKNIAYRK